MMRVTAAVLVLAMACRHGRVTVHPDDVASHVAELNEKGRAKVPAGKQRWSSDWSRGTTTIRADQPVEVTLWDGNRWSLEKHTFGELLADCPSNGFEISKEAREANPGCKLLATDNDTIAVGRTTYPGPFFWGATGGAVGLGIVACAAYCDSPFSEVSTATVVVGGLLAVAVIAGVVVLLSKSR